MTFALPYPVHPGCEAYLITPGTHCKYRIGEFTPLLSCVELTVNIRGEFYE